MSQKLGRDLIETACVETRLKPARLYRPIPVPLDKFRLAIARQEISRSIRYGHALRRMDVPSIDREYWTKDRCESIEIVRFRPNIVVEAEGGGGAGGGLNPFEEDGWVEVQIGEEKNTIYCVARCARCMVRSLWAFRRPNPRNLLAGF